MSESTPLQGLEHVRQRPGMYIGDPDQRGLCVCVFELIASSLEEHLAGYGACITVTIHDDGSLSVQDEGHGISTAIEPAHGVPFIERAMTTLLYNPDDYLKRPYHVLGLCGVGAKCVNALSEWMRVNTVWGGNEYQIAFARGRTSEPLKKLLPSESKRGTTIRFKPDKEIFRVTRFDRNTLAVNLESLAVLHPGLQFWLVDERPNPINRPLVACFHYPGGIAELLNINCPQILRCHPEPITLACDQGGIKITLGFQYTDTSNVLVSSFVNSSPTRKGGTHVRGLLQGLAGALNELRPQEQPFRPADMRHGLNAFIGVWLQKPYYNGSTNEELANTEVESAVRQFTISGIKQLAAKSEDWAGWLVESLDEARRGLSDED